jgi:hypothetical protein
MMRLPERLAEARRALGGVSMRALRRLVRLRRAVAFDDRLRTAPISRVFGVDRGTPIDRYYIERFLAQEARSIRGAVLEVGDDVYTRRFAQAGATRAVLHATVRAQKATGRG